MLQFALCYALLPAMERQLQLAVGSQLRGRTNWSEMGAWMVSSVSVRICFNSTAKYMPVTEQGNQLCYKVHSITKKANG